MSAVLDRPDDIDDRVDYNWLSAVDTLLICTWLMDLGVNPHHTPVGAEIEYDPVHNEWRIEQWHMAADGGPVIRPDGTCSSYIVRRPHRGVALPWPTWGQLIDDLWNKVTDPGS